MADCDLILPVGITKSKWADGECLSITLDTTPAGNHKLNPTLFMYECFLAAGGHSNTDDVSPEARKKLHDSLKANLQKIAGEDDKSVAKLVSLIMMLGAKAVATSLEHAYAAAADARAGERMSRKLVVSN